MKRELSSFDRPFSQESRLEPADPRRMQQLQEAGVHRARRSHIWIASFTGPAGGQLWRSSGLTDCDEALLLAQHPILGELWRRHGAGELPEAISAPITPAEILALFDLAVPAHELHLLEKNLEWLGAPVGCDVTVLKLATHR